MIIILTEKATPDQIEQAAKDFNGYIKFVVDLKKKILAAGGLRHAEAEEVLLKNGSKQDDLWGGGWDLESDQLDYDSMINIRPNQNPSREVLSRDIRGKMGEIVKKLLLP